MYYLQLLRQSGERNMHMSSFLVKCLQINPALQPSSAAAERVFSLLNNSFKEQLYSSLEDYIDTSIMLQYNAK